MRSRKFCNLMVLFFLAVVSSLTYGADQISIASVQYPIEGNQTLDQVLKKVEAFVKEASEQKADLVLLPEWVTLDTWPLDPKVNNKVVVGTIAREITEPYWIRLKELSKKYKLVIAGGSTAKEAGGRTFNSAVVVFPNGRLLEQRKTYLTKWEKDTAIASGESPLVFETSWGTMAMLICYDVEFPDLSLELSKKEIDVILVPSMTESKEGLNRVRWAAQSRAVEHTSYVVISSTVGSVSKDWTHFGQAVFLSPQLPGMKGVLKEGVLSKPGVWVQTLDLKKLSFLKKNSSWRPSRQLRHR